MHLEGTPSDQLPDVLATGRNQVGFAFLSLSAREPDGRDADYIEWHSLDHRPEQYRLDGLRHALRVVSTPECRGVRAASAPPFDAVDHVMTYMFTGPEPIDAFSELGGALHRGGRMPLRLPSIGYLTGGIAGMAAAARAVAGADVVAWRPALGIYLLVEEGAASPADLVEVPGVAGVWWFDGGPSPAGYEGDATGKRVTICFLDEDPVAVGRVLGERVRGRWRDGAVSGLLAAPFFTVVPFDWGRHLPG